ncbi:MAG: hypothetical protein Q8O28_10920 [Smithellaceae bacterium]|nr:hypothetical protein [Smithellaceae bacterium]
MLKKYQPGRPDLLINTDWGIPRDSETGLSLEKLSFRTNVRNLNALNLFKTRFLASLRNDTKINYDTASAWEKGRNLLLFHDRWVTKEEKKQLQDERNAYASIRVIGYLLLFICVPVLINIRSIAEGGITDVALAVLYAFAASVTGSGLIRYARYARYPAILIFLSFFILPFMPLFESEKGAPLLFIMGVLCLYYLLRKTARKILWPKTQAKPAGKKLRPFVRGIIIAMALLAGLMVGYFVYDLNQARHLAADACRQATSGMPLEEFLSRFSKEDYKIIRSSEYALIVPKRGLGRNHCAVIHDGRTITGAKPGYVD